MCKKVYANNLIHHHTDTYRYATYICIHLYTYVCTYIVCTCHALIGVYSSNMRQKS